MAKAIKDWYRKLKPIEIDSGLDMGEEGDFDDSPSVQEHFQIIEEIWRTRVATRKYVAELIGTLVLVLMGCGAAVLAQGNVTEGGVGFMGVAFAFGLALLAMFYAIGGISGCHINPAVSISMLALGRMNVKDAVGYVIAQCIGAILGAGVLYVIASGIPIYSLAANGLGQNGFGQYSLLGISMPAAFVAETTFTFILLFVIIGSTREKAPKSLAGIAMGLTLVLIYIVGIPLTGASVNPARSLGPAVFVGGAALSQLWLFWVAPISGGLVAAAAWKLLGEPTRTLQDVS